MATDSITRNAESVAITLWRRSPAAVNKASYSSRLRSLPRTGQFGRVDVAGEPGGHTILVRDVHPAVVRVLEIYAAFTFFGTLRGPEA